MAGEPGMIPRLLREPLLHFLLLGAAAFGVDSLLAARGVDADSRTIVVSHDRLVTFLRDRTPQLDASAAASALDSLPPEGREALVREYVRTEALYREARALGLDRGDYAIRRRLVQQMEHLLRSLEEPPAEVAPDLVARHYAAHRAQYRQPAQITFAQVFVAPRPEESEQQSRERAARLLGRLEAGRVPFHEAPAYGDPFPYGVNHVRRTAEEVAADFGAEAQARLFALDPDPRNWQGPLRSGHGWHLVMITERQDAADPPLELLRERLQRDARRAQHERQVDAAIEALVARYGLRIDPALELPR